MLETTVVDETGKGLLLMELTFWWTETDPEKGKK